MLVCSANWVWNWPCLWLCFAPCSFWFGTYQSKQFFNMLFCMLVRLVPVCRPLAHWQDQFLFLQTLFVCWQGQCLWLHVVNPVKLNQLMAAIMLIVSSGCKLQASFIYKYGKKLADKFALTWPLPFWPYCSILVFEELNLESTSMVQLMNKGSSFCVIFTLVLVVQRLDNTIHRINLHPVNSAAHFFDTYLLVSDLSVGQNFPHFEQQDTGVQLNYKGQGNYDNHTIIYLRYMYQQPLAFAENRISIFDTGLLLVKQVIKSQKVCLQIVHICILFVLRNYF